MDSQKRGRGRPRGSGINDDQHLLAIAGLLLDNPKLTLTTAMRRVLRSRERWLSSDSAIIRRWQLKWKAVGDACIQRTRDARAAAERQRQERTRLSGLSAWDLMAELGRSGQHMPSWATKLEGIPNTSAFRELARRTQVLPIHLPIIRQMEELRLMTEAAMGPMRGMKAFSINSDLQRTIDAISRVEQVAGQTRAFRMPAMPKRLFGER